MHIQPLVKTIQQSFSGEAAKRNVAEIARHHRLQASPGYRAAAEWLAESLQTAGLVTTIERYPANEKTRFWTLQSFQEWDCRAATLDWLRTDGSVRLFAGEYVQLLTEDENLEVFVIAGEASDVEEIDEGGA